MGGFSQDTHINENLVGANREQNQGNALENIVESETSKKVPSFDVQAPSAQSQPQPQTPEPQSQPQAQPQPPAQPPMFFSEADFQSFMDKANSIQSARREEPIDQTEDQTQGVLRPSVVAEGMQAGNQVISDDEFNKLTQDANKSLAGDNSLEQYEWKGLPEKTRQAIMSGGFLTGDKQMDQMLINGYASKWANDQANKAYAQITNAQLEKDAAAEHAEFLAAQEQSDAEKAAETKKNNEDLIIAGTSNQRVSGPKPSISNRALANSVEVRKSQLERSLDDYSGMGNEVHAQLSDDHSVPMDSVGVGIDLLMAAYLNGGKDIRNLVEKYTGSTPEDLSANLNELRLALYKTFSYKNQIRVPTAKYPVSEDPSAQSRIIICHSGQGIYVHPIVHKQYNADFDGDEMNVGFDEERGASIKKASDFFLSSANKALFDPSFFGMKRIFDPKSLGNDFTMVLKEKDIVNLVSNFSVTYFDQNLNNELTFKISNDEAKKIARLVNENYRYQIEAAQGKNVEERSIWEDLMREITNYAYNSVALPYADQVACRILEKLYNLSYDVRIFDATVLDYNNQYMGPMVPDQYSTDDLKPIEVSVPDPPTNFLDLMEAFGMPIGRREGKNVIFRITSNFGKEIKSIIETAADPSGWISPNQWKSVTDEVFTKMMSSRISHGDRKVAVNAYIRSRVIREVGVPNFGLIRQVSADGAVTQQGFEEWINNFAAAYNRMANVVNAANSQFTTDLKIINKTGIDYIKTINVDEYGTPITLNELASPFLKVYGEYKMDRLFGAISIKASKRAEMAEDWRDCYNPAIHGQFTLARWIQVTRYASGSVTDEKGRNNVSPKAGPETFIRVLANLRSSYASRFNKQLEDALDKTAKQLRFFTKSNLINNPDYVAISEAMANNLMLLGPEVFEYFGLNTLDGFRFSTFGQELLNCVKAQPGYSMDPNKAADRLGGVWMKIMAAYRLDPIMRDKAAWIKAKNTPGKSVKEIAKLKERWEYKLQELASSSDLWKALVLDFQNNGNAINEILLGNMGMKEKCDRLALYIKAPIPGGNTGFDIDRQRQGWEIPSMLVANPRTLTMNNMYMTDLGHGAWLDNLSDLSDRMDGFVNKNLLDIKRDVKKTMTYCQNNGISISEYFNDVASGKVQISICDVNTLANGFVAGIVPTYKSTEKGQKEAAVNHGYNTVSLIKNGDVFSDLAQCDDAYFNKIPVDRLIRNQVMLVKILTDPTFSVDIYAGDSEPTTINQEVLFGHVYPSDEEIWKFLFKHERLAMMLRKTSFSSSYDGESTYKAASTLLSTMQSYSSPDFQSEELFNRALNAVIDRPSFQAVMAMFIPVKGQKGYNVAQMYKDRIESVIKGIAMLDGFSYQDIRAKLAEIAPEVENFKEVINEGDLNRDYGLIGPGQLLDEFAEALVELSSDLHKAGVVDELGESSLTWDDIIFEPQNLINFHNQKQLWSGAKTATSVGINGAESQRNAAMGWLSTDVGKIKDCGGGTTTKVSLEEVQENISDYRGAHTVSGMEINSATIYDIQPDQDGMIEIVDNFSCESKGCCCLKHQTADATSNEGTQNQTTSHGAYLGILRSEGAEGGNLKAVSNPDGADSIIKIHIMDDYMNGKFEQIKDNVTILAETGAIGEARKMLAKSMQEWNYNCGYDQLGLQDYYNLAHLLIRETEDGVRIVSVEQLNQIISEISIRLQKDPKFKPKDDDWSVVLNEALENWKPRGKVDIEKVLNMIEVPSVSNVYNKGIYPYLSSFDRNVMLMDELTDKYFQRNPNARAYSKYELDKIALAMEQKHYKTPFAAYVKSHKYIPAKKNNKKNTAKDQNDENKNKKEMAEKKEKGKVIENYYKNTYRFFGYCSLNNLDYTEYPGPNIAWVVDNSASPSDVEKMIEIAKLNGNTVFFEEKLRLDSQEVLFDEVQNGYARINLGDKKGRGYVVSFFDLQLNGPANPEGSFNVGESRFRPEELARFVSDELNENRNGDAGLTVTEHYANRQRVRATKREEFFCQNLFRELIDDGMFNFNVRMASVADIRQMLEWGQNDGPELCLGVDTEKHPEEQTRFDEALVRYMARLDEVYDDGFLPSARPDDIIGWAIATKVNKAGEAEDYWAPIRAFDIYRGEGSFSEFDVDSVESHINERGSIVVNYSIDTSVLHHQFKIFQDGMASNKLTSDGEPMEDRQLKNGTYLDGYFSKESTESRELLLAKTNPISTLMWESRLEPYLYNLAELTDTFPNNPDLKQKLLNGDQITFDEWNKFLNNDGVFFSEAYIWNNPQWGDQGSAIMNAFLKQTCQKLMKCGVDPATFLSSRNQTEGPTYKFFNWNIMYKSSNAFKDCMLAFHHSMNPYLCPEYSLAEYNGELFNGELMVETPFRGTDGKIHYRWQYMVTGLHFLDSHFDSMTGLATTGKVFSVPSLNAMTLGGRPLRKDEVPYYLDWQNRNRNENQSDVFITTDTDIL